MDKINIFINSKYRKENENSNKFMVKIPNNLLRLDRNEYFTLNVNGFYCYNSWLIVLMVLIICFKCYV